MNSPKPLSAEHFLNRELSLLAFNERVLAMAEDETVPALEKLKYVCIVSNNLDELFEIRVSGIKAQFKTNPDALHDDGYTPATTFKAVSDRAHVLVDRQYRILNDKIFPLLAQKGIHFHLAASLNDAQRQWAHQYFQREVLSVLTPIGLDPTHPFPRVLNKSLNFIVELKGKDSYGRDSGVAVLQAPRALPPTRTATAGGNAAGDLGLSAWLCDVVIDRAGIRKRIIPRHEGARRTSVPCHP